MFQHKKVAIVSDDKVNAYAIANEFSNGFERDLRQQTLEEMVAPETLASWYTGACYTHWDGTNDPRVLARFRARPKRLD